MDTLQQVAAAMEGGALDTQKLVRALLESALNAIMDEQADMACEGGANSRNGYRERGLLTPAGKITLRIPKLRCGTYFPDGILERYGRVDKAVAAAVAEMYATGVPTRKVGRVAAKLGIERPSASQVSRVCERLDAEVARVLRRHAVPVPRRYVREVPARRPRAVDGGGHRHRGRRRRRQARRGALRHRHRDLRRVARVLPRPAQARGLRRQVRDQRRPRGAAPRDSRVLPGRGVAALHRAPGAQRVLAAQVEAPPQGRRRDHAGGVLRVRAGLGARGPPRGDRRDRRLLPRGGRIARGSRGRRAGLPGLPRRAPPPHTHEQRPGARTAR